MKKSELVIGQEATQMHRNRAYARVRIEGYGYRKPRRYNQDPVQSDGATGVLVSNLNYQTGEVHGQSVVPLRMLDVRTFAEIRAAEEAAHDAEDARRHEHQARQVRETARLREIREMLAAFEVEGTVTQENYNGLPKLSFNVEQAERLLFALDTQGAQS